MPTVQDIQGNDYPVGDLVLINKRDGLAIDLNTKKAVTIASINGETYSNVISVPAEDSNGAINDVAVVVAGTEDYFLREITKPNQSNAEETIRLRLADDRYELQLLIEAFGEKSFTNNSYRAENIIVAAGRALVKFPDGTAGIYKPSINHSSFQVYPHQTVIVRNLDISSLEICYHYYGSLGLSDGYIAGNDFINDNNIIAGEVKPLTEGFAGTDEVARLYELSDDQFIDYVLERIGNTPSLASRLNDSLVQRFDRSAQYTISPADTISLPDKPPRLWAERPDEERGMNAAAWIRKVYAPWLGHGLARHHVGKLDPDLGQSYTGWTKKGRHPEDAISEFADGNPHGRLDDDEAGRRHREAVKASKARKAAKVPQPKFVI